MQALLNRLVPGVFVLIMIAGVAPISGGAGALLAQEPTQEDGEYGASYARLRYFDGESTLQRTLVGEIIVADIIVPLVAGDSLWTGNGRIEVELADGAILWLDEHTRLDLRSLSDYDNQYETRNLLALVEGSLRVQVPDPAEQESSFQIDTEGGSIYPVSAGSLRIDAEGGVTTVSSFRGVAELSGDRGSVLVRSGERSSVRVDRAPNDPRPFNTQRLDDFDQFCEERLEAYLRLGEEVPIEEIREEVPPAVYPYVGELSFYGGWQNVSTYGWVWRPRYSGSWGPYMYGYWANYPTGWVWISYDPWGWAPYHYGRWDYTVSLGWFWIPGARWSGAWVSFAVGSSYIGWCPLNYYNYPVHHDAYAFNTVNVRINDLNGRGWRFAPVGRFATRGGRGVVVNTNRVPRGTRFVVTGGLPHFNPKRVASHPDHARKFVDSVRAKPRPLKTERGPSGRHESFRTIERHSPRRIDRRDHAAGQTERRHPQAGIKRTPGDSRSNDNAYPRSGRTGAVTPPSNNRRVTPPRQAAPSRRVAPPRSGSAPKATRTGTNQRREIPDKRSTRARGESEKKVSPPARSRSSVIEQLVDGMRRQGVTSRTEGSTRSAPKTRVPATRRPSSTKAGPARSSVKSKAPSMKPKATPVKPKATSRRPGSSSEKSKSTPRKPKPSPKKPKDKDY